MRVISRYLVLRALHSGEIFKRNGGRGRKGERTAPQSAPVLRGGRNRRIQKGDWERVASEAGEALSTWSPGSKMTTRFQEGRSDYLCEKLLQISLLRAAEQYCWI